MNFTSLRILSDYLDFSSFGKQMRLFLTFFMQLFSYKDCEKDFKICLHTKTCRKKKKRNHILHAIDVHTTVTVAIHGAELSQTSLMSFSEEEPSTQFQLNSKCSSWEYVYVLACYNSWWLEYYIKTNAGLCDGSTDPSIKADSSSWAALRAAGVHDRLA